MYFANSIARMALLPGWNCGIAAIPKGLCRPAQGCEERATLGGRAEADPTPTGLRLVEGRTGRNPIGVGDSEPPVPRVARGSQPWALRRNPFGIPIGNFRKAFGLEAVLLLAAFAFMSCKPSTAPANAGEGEDPQVRTLGTIEVTARLVEIPEGAIFQRDLYDYATILKYEVLSVHRGAVEKGDHLRRALQSVEAARRSRRQAGEKHRRHTETIPRWTAPPHGARNANGRPLHGRDRGQVFRQTRRPILLGRMDKQRGVRRLFAPQRFEERKDGAGT